VASTSRRPLTVPRRLLLFWSLPVVLIGVGTLGYRVIERWPWFDSLYVTVVTLTSMGYGDKHAPSIAGRVLTIGLALGGISTIAVAATELLGMFITGELRDFWGRWRMGKRIDALEHHVIVCGYGQVGQHVCADLLEASVPVVAIDRSAAPLEAARDAGVHLVVGDATSDAALRSAGIDRARALVAVAGADADNVLITMTARLLRPLMTIVSSVEDDSTVPKLVRAGATRTASPAAIAGGRMAQAVLRPSVLDADLEMEEQLVGPGSALDGKTVGTSGLRARRGQILVAIKRRDGRLAFDPEDDAPVDAGDTLITLCRRGQGSDAFALSP
jgi:voltage-gated potassium channel